MDTHSEFATISPEHGTIPGRFQRQSELDESGARVSISVQDGKFLLAPHLAIPAEQAWFWAPTRQEMEREADEDLQAGRILEFADGPAFLRHLDGLIDDEQL